MSSNLDAAKREQTSADFLEAMGRQAFDVAEAILPDLPAALPAAARRALAQLHMHRERWIEAAEAYATIGSLDPQDAFHARMCRNLSSLKVHRPAVYRALADADIADAYALHATASGRMTISARSESGVKLLGDARDPSLAAVNAIGSLEGALRAGECVALLSIGDGYFLHALSHAIREHPLGRQQAIYLFEPDARLLLACFLIHDFTGPSGPIERENVLWFVGPKWADGLKLAMHTERFLPFPKYSIKQAIDPAPMERAIAATLESLGRLETESLRAIEAHYRNLASSDFAQAFAGKAGRAPRVLLVTTRFSTVLQHSTRDTADAFRQLGFEAHVMIEPTAHHAITRLGIRRTIAEFKPDLVFQIDHHRFEHGDLFPPNVPFVNWIQDLLPHLMLPSTGRKLGANDFVLAPSLQRWVSEFVYPESQCLEFRKLTRVPTRPTSRASDDGRVVYVSNWSQSPKQMSDELIRWAGEGGTIMAKACERMTLAYGVGETFYTPGDCRRLIARIIDEGDHEIGEAFIGQAATRMFDRLNNLLYRHQGLHWAAAACEREGLSLEIYGNGWSTHADFGAFAKGPIDYGQPLESLTRRAGVNLVLEPFVCVSHQRLLDALVAGGFCIVRDHPSTHLLHGLVDLLSKTPASTAVDALTQLGGADAALLSNLLSACVAIEASPGTTDFVASVRRQQASGFLPNAVPLLPHLDGTSFADPSQLSASLQRFSRDPELRSTIARSQRTAVEGRYAYDVGMAKVVAFVTQRLEAAVRPQSRAA